MIVHLVERHLRELHEASAIADDVIAERGYRTVTDANELLDLGFADYQARPGLLIPLHGTDGSNGRYALKPLEPRVGRDGKPRKYEYPAGQSPILDVPVRCLEQLTDATVPLVFTEGAKKADCLAGLGYCTVNIWGVHSWYRNPEHGGFATIEEIADWEPIKPTLDGRICYVAFDSDAWTKPGVALALRRLANFLARAGALVFIVRLPDAADGSKQGLDDLVAHAGADAFQMLVDAAEPWGSVAMVRKLEAELRDLRQQRSAEAEVMRNPELRATEKLVAIAAIRESGWRQSTHAVTPFVVNQGRLATAAGLKSRQTVGRALDVLASANGPFDKQTTREFSEAAGWVSVTRLTPRHSGVTPMLKATAAHAPPRPAWGGHHPRCPDHPNADVVERRTLACAECGQVLGEPEFRILKLQVVTSETATVVSPTLRTTELQVVTSETCRRCGRPWDVHGGVDVFGICAEPFAPQSALVGVES